MLYPGQILYCEETYLGKSPFTNVLDLELDKIKQKENRSSSELILSLDFFFPFWYFQVHCHLLLKEIVTLI